jgi:uncharacterized repeat protein (TIGR04042 family)
MRFVVQWPNGDVETCYSPSLVVHDYLEEGRSYELDDFVERGRVALQIASERVRAKYGVACSRALDQLRRIEDKAAALRGHVDGHVRVVSFEGPRP